MEYSNIAKRLKFLPSIFWDIYAVIGGWFYIYRSYLYIHSLPGMLDEGTYLYKGLLFVNRIYHPFQAYGPWTNKMPYLFYLFGFAQEIFGAGLRTGRYFALFLSSTMLVSLWLGIRRWVTPFWAGIIIWIFALSPLTIISYAYATSEVVVGAFLAFALVCLIGDKRSQASLYCGIFWFSFMSLIRAHMAILGLFALIYIYLRYGKKIFLDMLFFYFFVLLFGYLLYWPDVLRLWQPFIPKNLQHFFPGLIPNLNAYNTWSLATENISLLQRFHSLSVALASEVFIIFGQIMLGLYFLRTLQIQKLNKKDANLWIRQWLTVFMPAYFLYYAIFIWNTFAHNYCIDCLKTYARFITPLGFINTILLFVVWEPLENKIIDGIITILSFVISGIIGFSLWEYLDRSLLYFPIPRFWTIQFQSTTTIRSILNNKLHVSYGMTKLIISIGLALVLMTLLLTFIIILNHYINNKRPYGYRVIISVLFIAVLSVFFTYREERACAAGFDALVNNKTVGQALNNVIGGNQSLVFWAGGHSIVPLLYVQNIRTFPQQYNGGYGKFIDGNTNTLLKYGFYNNEAEDIWLQSADYFVIQRQYLPNYADILRRENMVEIPLPSIPLECGGKTDLHVFAKRDY